MTTKPKRANKTKTLRFRVTSDEKREIEQSARRRGVDTVSAYLLLLHRESVAKPR